MRGPAASCRQAVTPCVSMAYHAQAQHSVAHPSRAPWAPSSSPCLTQPSACGSAFLGSSTSTQHDAQRAQEARRNVVAHAQRQRRPVEDDVELDDGGGSFGGEGFSIGPLLQQAWSALTGVTERLTDIVYDYTPEGVSRPTVGLAVKTGLVLVLIGFARSILGFVLTVGTVVLGLFVASRVLGIEAGQQPQRRRGRGDGKWGSGGSRARPDFDRPPRRLPSGIAKESDVLDVWFETKDTEKDRRRQR